MSGKTKKTETKDVVTPYEPTPYERAAVVAYVARKKEKPLAPRMKVSMKRDVATISPDHPDAGIGHLLLMKALGTTESDFIDGLLAQLANAATKGRAVDDRGLNFMLAVVKDIEPKDQVEAMLAAQMAAVHNATRTFARRLAHVENIPQQDSAERAFSKLARTFAAQVEALKRYRSGGEQTVRVEHVTVNEGGQAIVGNVSTGGGARRKRWRRPHERGLSVPKEPALFRDLEVNQTAVHGSRRDRLDRLPLPWSAGRRTEGRAQRHVSARAQHEGGREGAPPRFGPTSTIARNVMRENLMKEDVDHAGEAALPSSFHVLMFKGGRGPGWRSGSGQNGTLLSG
jgi:hypothetical protein